jgi:hypothetical protein
VSAIVLGMGLHWAILQSVAWTGMIIRYSQSASLLEAIGKTFDGHHPCPLCKLVKAGKNSEQKQDGQMLLLKLDLFVPVPAQEGLFALVLEPLANSSRVWNARLREHPPTPPPRMV